MKAYFTLLRVIHELANKISDDAYSLLVLYED